MLVLIDTCLPPQSFTPFSKIFKKLAYAYPPCNPYAKLLSYCHYIDKYFTIPLKAVFKAVGGVNYFGIGLYLSGGIGVCGQNAVPLWGYMGEGVGVLSRRWGDRGAFFENGGHSCSRKFFPDFFDFFRVPLSHSPLFPKILRFPQKRLSKKFSPKIFQNFQDPLLVFAVLALLVFIARPVGITLSKPIFLRPEKTFPVGTTFRKNFFPYFFNFSKGYKKIKGTIYVLSNINNKKAGLSPAFFSVFPSNFIRRAPRVKFA